MEKKRFAVLLCAEDSEYVKKRYGGYFGVFVGLLAEEGEVWEVFGVCQGEFPADDQLPFFDGFVITGSCSDADGNDAWILSLVALLQKLDSMRKKLLGICFGHQVGFHPPFPFSLSLSRSLQVSGCHDLDGPEDRSLLLRLSNLIILLNFGAKLNQSSPPGCERSFAVYSTSLGDRLAGSTLRNCDF